MALQQAEEFIRNLREDQQLQQKALEILQEASDTMWQQVAAMAASVGYEVNAGELQQVWQKLQKNSVGTEEELSEQSLTEVVGGGTFGLTFCCITDYSNGCTGVHFCD